MMSNNPWVDLVDKKASVDFKSIGLLNNKLHDNHRLDNEFIPEPFIGDKDAPIYLLIGNPGLPVDMEKQRLFESKERNKKILFDNLKHLKTDYPFYYLRDEFQNTEGAKWWRKVFKGLKEIDGDLFTDNNISKSFFAVEQYGYHSKNLNSNLFSINKIPSISYTIELVKKAMSETKIIILTRGIRVWMNAVPELKDYDDCYFLALNRGITISSVTMSPTLIRKVKEKMVVN